MGCVLLPDIVRWRFGGGGSSPADRFLGKQRGIRNTFGRLWWRCEALKSDRESGYDRVRTLLERLGEDQLVQITERPALAANRVVARAIAEAYLRRVATGNVSNEELMREAVKRLRRRLAFVAYEALLYDEVEHEIESIVQDAAVALGAPRTTTEDPAGSEAEVRSPDRVTPEAPRGQSAAAMPRDNASPEDGNTDGSPENEGDLNDLAAWERGDISTESVLPTFRVSVDPSGVSVVATSGHGNAFRIEDGEDRVTIQRRLRSLAADGGVSLQLAITANIVGSQREFLKLGVLGLLAKSQADVAKYLGVHESSISRALPDTYVATVHGIFPLRFFFSASVPHHSGRKLSARAVRAAIRTRVLQERPDDPLTDDRIAEWLVDIGFSIARRTVAKYRHVLQIPDARDRRGGNWRSGADSGPVSAG